MVFLLHSSEIRTSDRPGIESNVPVWMSALPFSGNHTTPNTFPRANLKPEADSPGAADRIR